MLDTHHLRRRAEFARGYARALRDIEAEDDLAALLEDLANNIEAAALAWARVMAAEDQAAVPTGGQPATEATWAEIEERGAP
ncbi:hypothetical protein [Roseospirillum parvum]|uniref:Uncharacterized protein n=1 Tax=Roseospirillum parvum TaxID=83401 RepID=A0A1G8GIA6_9PROT|nr:hypothetical protein [Roseospirillum parvum]SDH94139.1 hypothetical protein SAMN05421742_1286 [Roseospirillum parvum]